MTGVNSASNRDLDEREPTLITCVAGLCLRMDGWAWG